MTFSATDYAEDTDLELFVLDPIPTAAGDRRELLRQPPTQPFAKRRSGQMLPTASVSTQAAATAAAEDVVRLEAPYQHAFTAIETPSSPPSSACSNSAANSAHGSRPPSSASQ